MTRLLPALFILGFISTALAQDVGAGRVVVLDYFFNHQVKNGQQFHYIWDDTANSGYSKFGDVWKQYGATLAKLEKAPTADDLAKFSIYIIVNPSTEKTAADHKPNYIQPADADVIAAWVHDGGVLALFANDKNTSEIEHFSMLAQRFGITFNNDIRNAPIPTHAEQARGAFSVFPDHPLFKGIDGSIYMKEICTLAVQDPAQALLTAPKPNDQPGTDVIMAASHYGKGLVFAVGDPWIYNEYIDVANPTIKFQNRKAAENLCQWLLSAARAPAEKVQ
jgi:unsaturated rhamnogalacturonyl hydrolase